MDGSPLLDQLQCYLLPAKGRYCHSDFISHYEQTFQLWFENTQFALNEEKNDLIALELSSDPFLECDETAAIFHGNIPVGLFMFRWIDIRFTPNQSLNAIKKRFPTDLMTTIYNKKITHIMTMGNLVVDPNWRRSKIGFGISDMLMGFALARFVESRAEVLLTTTRNNRSTNQLCYRQGGIKYADNAVVFGVESDLVVFYKDSIKPLDIPCLTQKTDELWKNKKVAWIDMPLSFIRKAHDPEYTPT